MNDLVKVEWCVLAGHTAEMCCINSSSIGCVAFASESKGKASSSSCRCSCAHTGRALLLKRQRCQFVCLLQCRSVPQPLTLAFIVIGTTRCNPLQLALSALVLFLDFQNVLIKSLCKRSAAHFYLYQSAGKS